MTLKFPLTFFVFLAFLCLSLERAQGQNDSIQYIIDTSGTGQSFTDVMSDVIEPLDKSLITSGILADKAYILSPMRDFSGESRVTESTIADVSRWKQMYRQLYDGSIRTNVIPSSESISDLAEGYLSQSIFPIVLANISYNQIKDDALDSNLLTFSNGQLHDVSGRNQSPYDNFNFFGASVLKQAAFSGQVTFVIDSRFIISNSIDSILAIDIDFDDGGGFVHVFGSNNRNTQNITINYSSTGDKILIVKAKLSNNSILQTGARFSLNSTSSVTPDASFNVTGSLPFNGAYGTGKAYVLFGCNNTQLRKPIIVSDGFDPSNERHFNELYDLLNKNSFIEKARADGFDFVILDYNSGGDFIQRNAYVLISTINNVNAQLAANNSTSKLTIVGPSMAGLISRYALYYMEQNNLDHNTQLYVSFDSPHLGANVPLGDQHWLNFFANTAHTQGAIDSRAKLTTPAAEQMLVYHYTSFPNVHGLRNGLLNDPYFNFPSKCRKVALANGSGNNTNFFNPCDQLVHWVYHVNGYGDAVIGNTWAVPAPNNGLCTVFDGRFTFTTSVLGVTVPIGTATQTVKVSGTKPYDSSPGGAFPTDQSIIDGLSDNHAPGSYSTNHPNNCFIPTVSSLCLLGAPLGFNVHSGLTNYPYINNSSITPFDAVFAPTTNQDHVFVSLENIGWMRDEVSPLDLFLQNLTISDNANYEGRNTVTTGHNVDPVAHRHLVGDFITDSHAKVNIQAGEEIAMKFGTEFRPGTNANIFIQAFPCSATFRFSGTNDTTNLGIGNGFEAPEVSSFSQSPSLEIEPANKLKVYPNPNIGTIIIEKRTEIPTKFTVRDVTGKLILENVISTPGPNLVNLDNVENGIYLLEAKTGDLFEKFRIIVTK